jgi:hypothetical protein
VPRPSDRQVKASNYFEVDLSKLNSDAREQLKSGLKAVIDNLIEEYKRAEKDYREVQTVIDDEREDVDEELK